MRSLDVEQGSEEWFVARRGLLTGSKLGRIITPKTGKLSAQADTVIAELIAESVEGESETFSTYWTERGISMEAEARSWYEFEYGVTIEQVGIILNRGCGFSPDGFIAHEGMVEFKCPKASTHIRYLMSGELPDEYKAQVHGGLIICEVDWCEFVSYHPDFKPLVVRVEHDEFTEKLADVIDQFNERLEAVKQEVLK